MWSPWQTARNRTTQWDYQKLCVCRFLKGQLYSVPSNPLSVLRWKKYTRINYFIKLRKFSMGPETFETISETSSDSIKQQLHRGASQSTCWDAELSNCHKLNLKLVKNHHQKKKPTNLHSWQKCTSATEHSKLLAHKEGKKRFQVNPLLFTPADLQIFKKFIGMGLKQQFY